MLRSPSGGPIRIAGRSNISGSSLPSCRPSSTPKVTPGPAPDDTSRARPLPRPLRPQHLVGLMANANAVGTAPRGFVTVLWNGRMPQGSGPSIAPVPVGCPAP